MSHISANSVLIENGINFRDLGGLKTKDGRQIRHGVLFRAGAFSDLSEKDKHILANEIGIKYILDYRDESEAASQPDQIWHNSVYLNQPANPFSNEVTASINDDLDEKLSELLSHRDPAIFMVKLYQLLPFNNPAYHKLIDLLLNSNGQSIVQHCAVGKDRTGVGVALTLSILGIDEKMIMEDYLLTEQTLSEYREKLLAQFALNLTPEEVEQRRLILSAKPEFLQTAIDEIKKQYQSLDHWLEVEYQLTDEKRQIICDYYLI